MSATMTDAHDERIKFSWEAALVLSNFNKMYFVSTGVLTSGYTSSTCY